MTRETILIDHQSSSPFFNLASEEYFLHELDQDVVFLYENKDCVVIGKHQNAFDECAISYCNANNIQIARRLSGGGTVYHGEGNLNFCFILTGDETDKLIDFRKHLQPVNDFLHSIGIESVYSGRNDLLLDEQKISGNAEHVFARKKRVIHHGTLLFSADLKKLGNAIRPKDTIRFESHSVKSVRSKVTNISDHLETRRDLVQFRSEFETFLAGYFNAEKRALKPDEIEKINRLVETKFDTWEWNFGYSPAFKAILNLSHAEQLHVKVRKGVILEAVLFSGSNESNLNQLVGKLYKPETLELSGLDADFSVFF